MLRHLYRLMVWSAAGSGPPTTGHGPPTTAHGPPTSACCRLPQRVCSTLAAESARVQKTKHRLRPVSGRRWKMKDQIVRCSRCGSSEHTSNKCSHGALPHCVRCGLADHSECDCPVPADPLDRMCTHCSRWGHVVGRCPRLPCMRCGETGKLCRCWETKADRDSYVADTSNVDVRKAEEVTPVAIATESAKTCTCWRCVEARANRAEPNGSGTSEHTGGQACSDAVSADQWPLFGRKSQALCRRCGESHPGVRCSVAKSAGDRVCSHCGRSGHHVSSCDRLPCRICGADTHVFGQCDERSHPPVGDFLAIVHRCARCGSTEHDSLSECGVEAGCRCEHCALDHHVSKCPQLACLACGRSGHNHKRCIEKMKKLRARLRLERGMTRCVHCGSAAHVSAACDAGVPPRQLQHCTHCGRKGHIKEQCRRLPCINCGREDHVLSECLLPTDVFRVEGEKEEKAKKEDESRDNVEMERRDHDTPAQVRVASDSVDGSTIASTVARLLRRQRCVRCGERNHGWSKTRCSVGKDAARRGCTHCCQTGHHVSSCPLLPCKLCGQTGHVFTQCDETSSHPAVMVIHRRCKRCGSFAYDHTCTVPAEKSERVCSECGENGHHVSRCPRLPCLECGQMGHNFYTCLHQKRRLRAALQNELGMSLCRKCGSDAHSTSACDAPPRQEEVCGHCGEEGHVDVLCRQKPCLNCGRDGHVFYECLLPTKDKWRKG